jgi:hypothetical protein
VIDLAAWKADREEEARLEAMWYDGVDEALGEDLDDEYEAPAPRTRRSHKSALNLDLWASVGVIGVVAVLLVHVLLAF